MARKLRELVDGGIYHVYARGNRREPIFWSDDDRTQYLSIWGGVVRALGWRALGYCLMDNHVHHLVETPKADLHIGMRMAHGYYARYFNDLHGQVGHVFQGRYGSARAEEDGTLWYFASYIALNPVRAGMCENPDDHPWSSHAGILGRGERRRWLDADRLLSFFDPHPADALTRYAQVIEAVRLLGSAGFDPPITGRRGHEDDPPQP